MTLRTRNSKTRVQLQAPPPTDNPRRAKWLIMALLLLLVLAAYSRLPNCGFIVHYDDDDYVRLNPHVNTGLTGENLRWALTGVHAGNWHPLTWWSHMLDVQLFGMNPLWHHLVNLAWHAANTLLLFLLLHRLTGGRRETLWLCALVAGLFGLHPQHVESVAWISERKDVLSVFFGLLTIWYYCSYAQRPSVKYYLLMVGAFILGLMAKSMLVTLPLVLVLLDYWPLGRLRFSAGTRQPAGQSPPEIPAVSWGKLITEKIPFLVLALGVGIIILSAQKQGGAVANLEHFSLPNRLTNASWSYLAYLGQMLAPVKLRFFYPQPEAPEYAKAAAAFIILAGISGGAWRLRRSAPYLPVGWLWYLATLVPVIGLVQVGSQARADRYTYLPSIGIYLILAWGGRRLAEKFRLPSRLRGALCGAVLLLLAGWTWRTTGFWRSGAELFGRAVSVDSKNYVGYNLLGLTRLDQGNLEGARVCFQKMVEFFPEDLRTLTNLGSVLAKQGREPEAEPWFRQAVRLSPDDYDVQVNYARLLAALNRWDQAIPHYEKALRLQPGATEILTGLGAACNNLAINLAEKKQYDEARRFFTWSLELQPQNLAVRHNLGTLLLETKDWAGARRIYQALVALRPEDADAWVGLADAANGEGNLKEAALNYRKALELTPGHAGALERLQSLKPQPN